MNALLIWNDGSREWRPAPSDTPDVWIYQRLRQPTMAQVVTGTQPECVTTKFVLKGISITQSFVIYHQAEPVWIDTLEDIVG